MNQLLKIDRLAGHRVEMSDADDIEERYYT